MIDDMTARRFKEKVQKDHVRRNVLFRTPTTATFPARDPRHPTMLCN
jgi:hypothetical protein